MARIPGTTGVTARLSKRRSGNMQSAKAMSKAKARIDKLGKSATEDDIRAIVHEELTAMRQSHLEYLVRRQQIWGSPE